MFRSLSLLAAAFLIALSGTSLAQGEGNGLDAHFQIGSNHEPMNDLDKPFLHTDLVSFRVSSATLPFGFPIIIFSAAPCGAPQPSVSFGGAPGVIGIDPSKVAVLYNGPATFPQTIIGFGGAFQINVNMPPGFGIEGDEDIFFQSAIYSQASGNPFGWAVSNTIRLTSVQPGFFQDTVHHANCAPALGEVDLGAPLMVDTARYNDELTASGFPAGVLDTTSFSVATSTTPPTGGVAEVVARFVAEVDDIYYFDSCGSTFDTQLYVLAADGVTPVALSDDSVCAQPTDSRVSVVLTAGQLVYVVLDGAAVGDEGLAFLTIDRAGNY